MPATSCEDDKKRRDPYDPRTGATGNDEPDESEDLETRERGSPGSGEDGRGAADLQPEDVEQGEDAR